MGSPAPDKIRNIALVGHSGTGKTTLAEAMLFTAGVTNRLGTIADGTTTSDFTAAEKERRFSISASLLHCDWKGHKVNVVDAPGYADFIGDAKAALWGADNALVVVSAQSGVEVGTDRACGFAEEFGRPVVFFVNHVDKEQADFDGTLEALQEHFGKSVAPLQLPANQGVGFNRIVDVLQNRLLTYPADGSGKGAASEVPGDLKDRVNEVREQIMDAVAESSDALLEKYLEEGELSEEEIAAGLRAGIANRSVFPVLCGDASRNIGADLLLDFLVKDVPSPADVSPHAATGQGSKEAVTLRPDPGADLAAVVFKTVSESVGDLSFIRVFSGTLKSSEEAYNSSREKNERVGQVYLLNGGNRIDVDAVSAGDMAALMKLKDTHTGNTLSNRRASLIVEPLTFPHPLIRIAVAPRSRGDEEKISVGLHQIHEEDPSFVSGYDPELKQIIVQGQGELHLTVVLDKLKRKFGVDVDQIEPRIPYRETVVGKAEGHHRHKKQTGGRGQFGEVYLRVEPRRRGEGYEFEDAVVGGSIPRNFLPAVEKGIAEALVEGVLAGYKVEDVKVTVYDGSYHPVDSSEMAFKLAGAQAFHKAFLDARPILLEPIYRIEVRVPDQYMGDVMGDMNSRRGRIQGMDPQGNFQVVRAEVPLSELYKYSTALRSMTQGTGDYTMTFSHYEQVPPDVTQKVVAKSKKQPVAVEA